MINELLKTLFAKRMPLTGRRINGVFTWFNQKSFVISGTGTAKILPVVANYFAVRLE